MIIESKFLKKYGRFEFFYMLVMVIYMAQATPETGRMVGTLSGILFHLMIENSILY